VHPGLQDYHCFIPYITSNWRTYVALLISFWWRSSIHGYSQSQKARKQLVPEPACAYNDCLFSAHIRALCDRDTVRRNENLHRSGLSAFRRRSPSCSPSRGSCSHISMFMIHPQGVRILADAFVAAIRLVEGSRTRRVQPKPLLSRVSRQMRPSLRMRGNDA
jgi:hypothetical protein